jgi:hypothetical protein
MLELFEVSRPRGRSMPFNSMMGDYGYCEIAVASENVLALASYFMDQDVELLADPTSLEVPIDGGWGLGWYMYVRDPDGIPVEFIVPVELLREQGSGTPAR